MFSKVKEVVLDILKKYTPHLKAFISEQFSDSSSDSYQTGDYCIDENNNFCKWGESESTPGPVRTTVGKELKELHTKLAGKSDSSHKHSWGESQIIGYYGSNDANTSGWYKVCTVRQTGYSDYSLNLLITQSFSRQATGLLHIHTRCNNDAAIILQTLKWMYRYGFNAGDAKIVTGDNTWSLYIYQTVAQHGRIQVQVLSKCGTAGDTSFTLSDNNAKESADPGGTAATDGANVNYASSAGLLQTARTINGTSFNGSGNITTSNWGTARTFTIGNTGKSVNGSGNASWSLSEIGAAPSSHVNTAGTSAAYGHVKVSDNYTSSAGGASSGVAASSTAVVNAYNACAKNGHTHSYAPVAHASAATTYGIGTASNYGHVKLNDGYAASGGNASQGVAASSHALNALYKGITGGTILSDNALHLKTASTNNLTSALLISGQDSSTDSSGNTTYTTNCLRMSTAAGNTTTQKCYLGYGTGANRWKQLYATTSTVSTSDRNKKNSIEPFVEVHEKLFYELKPVHYKLNDADTGRIHFGFISQDVEEALAKVGLTAMDFAGFCKDYDTIPAPTEDNPEHEEIKYDENGEPVYNYSLRYEEFISLNTHMIQKCLSEIQNLKSEIAKLKENI